jgi:pimeloyl-ACP methyl ester carboxylesterase
VPRYVDQACTAMDALQERGMPPRFVLLGLCSGAYWSMYAALRDERVAGVVMLNPRTLIWDEWVYARRRTRELREQMRQGSNWRRVLRGEITLARHLETAHALASRAADAPRRARQRLSSSERARGAGADPVDALFDSLRDRDQRVLLVLSGREPLREDFEASGMFERAGRWPNLELTVVGTSADTHTLTPLWLQREVHALADVALERELQRTASPPS